MDVQTLHKSVLRSKKTTKSKRSNKKDSLKVVYISSPMKVKTSASKFRSLVQELTGRHSDVSRYMEANGDAIDFHEIVGDDDEEDDDRVVPKSTANDERASFLSSMDTTSRESPTSSSSLLEPMDNVFNSQMDEQFGGLLSSNLLYDSYQFGDVLGSYDEL